MANKIASSAMDFADLQDIKNHLSGIARNMVASIKAYKHADKLGFRHQLSINKASLASTATCVAALQACGIWKEMGLEAAVVANWLVAKDESSKLPKYNPFSIAFVAEGVLDLCGLISDAVLADELKQRVVTDIGAKLADYLAKEGQTMFRRDLGAVAISPYPSSAYLTQLAYRVVHRCGHASQVDAVVRAWSTKEIYKQITLITAASRNGDAMQLLYALILAVSATEPGKATPEDKEIYAHALATFFGSQNADGSWPLSRPMFHYSDVGSAYCFDYEALTQLLQCQPLRDDLLDHLPSLRKAARLLDRTRYEFLGKDGKACVAWASGHHPQIEGPESWSTASVYHFVHEFEGLIAEAIRRSLFAQLRTVYPGAPLGPESVNRDLATFATDFLDADVDYKGDILSLRETLAERFVFPLANEVDLVAKGGRFSVAKSAILFGPPGTSKTQLAEIISGYLRWPLLPVDPSYLVQDGLDRVQAKANELFTMLVAAEQIVVLLDEFDEVGRDRNNNDNLLSRFITTAMLPKLAAIDNKKKIVFLLATNYVSGFDAAFRRSGRFDMVLQVMQPTLKAKLGKRDKAGKLEWEAPLSRAIELAAKGGTEEKAMIEGIIRDLTFLETKELVREIGKSDDAKLLTVIRSAGEACTLNKRNDVPLDVTARDPEAPPSSTAAALDEATGKDVGAMPAEAAAQQASPALTWRRSSELEARQMRLPTPG